MFCIFCSWMRIHWRHFDNCCDCLSNLQLKNKAGWRSWLEHHPDAPRLWIQPLVRARARINKSVSPPAPTLWMVVGGEGKKRPINKNVFCPSRNTFYGLAVTWATPPLCVTCQGQQTRWNAVKKRSPLLSLWRCARWALYHSLMKRSQFDYVWKDCLPIIIFSQKDRKYYTTEIQSVNFQECWAIVIGFRFIYYYFLP